MTRRSPANTEERREHIVAYGLVPGARVRDHAFHEPVFARVLAFTPANMARISYESERDRALHGDPKVCCPTRLRPAPIAPGA